MICCTLQLAETESFDATHALTFVWINVDKMYKKNWEVTANLWYLPCKQLQILLQLCEMFDIQLIYLLACMFDAMSKSFDYMKPFK